MKHIVVISQQAPYQQQSLKEALDLLLIFAAIDQEVSWLIEGDAVFALLAEQQPKLLGQKDFTKALKMLELYDIDSIYVCSESLSDRGMDESALILDVKNALAQDKQALLAKATQVVVL
ncbi:sulfurtransferase complex subunit TusC [Pseudoalteromonas sp. T1lg76]|uniref:sulfurtransferase complex subunit TusC n=1 Tax=Pseudoalteromonas sp. T1lg76 TaxID=2077103 RepID=UPI000CF6FEA7|nr:sulfurtransferase complex subunit TusC [Pseudoalteromonas sp. T1lg76]